MTSETSNTRITVSELSIGYTSKKKETIIVSDINFSAKKGALIALVGPNGIGKSTLIRTLTGMQSSIYGSIKISEVEISSLSPSDLAGQVSVVLTEAPASRNVTVYELIALGRQPYTNWLGILSQKDKEAVEHAIKISEVKNLQHKKCFELSDGQLQRVMIARALAQDTSLILLDEPTTHLDLYHKVHILKLLKSITKETRKTILFTSHEIEMAIQLCDKIVLMEPNKNSFGEPCELIARGAFDNLFPSNTVTFDHKTGTFRIQK